MKQKKILTFLFMTILSLSSSYNTVAINVNTNDNQLDVIVSGIEDGMVIRGTIEIIVNCSHPNGIDGVVFFVNEEERFMGEPDAPDGEYGTVSWTWNPIADGAGEYTITIGVTDNNLEDDWVQSYTVIFDPEDAGAITPEQILLIVGGIGSIALVATIAIVIYRYRKRA